MEAPKKKRRILSEEEFAILNKHFDGDIKKLTLGKIDKIEMDAETKRILKKIVKVKNSPDWVFLTPDKKFLSTGFGFSKKKISKEEFLKLKKELKDITDNNRKEIKKLEKEYKDTEIEYNRVITLNVNIFTIRQQNIKQRANLTKKQKQEIDDYDLKAGQKKAKELNDKMKVDLDNIKKLIKETNSLIKKRKKLEEDFEIKKEKKEPVKFEKLEQAVPSKKIVKKSLGQIKKPETKKEDPKLVKALKRLETLKNKPKSIIVNALIREQQFIINKLKELKRIKDLGGI